jgi:hypothetical protein
VGAGAVVGDPRGEEAVQDGGGGLGHTPSTDRRAWRYGLVGVAGQ